MYGMDGVCVLCTTRTRVSPMVWYWLLHIYEDFFAIQRSLVRGSSSSSSTAAKKGSWLTSSSLLVGTTPGTVTLMVLAPRTEYALDCASPYDPIIVLLLPHRDASHLITLFFF